MAPEMPPEECVLPNKLEQSIGRLDLTGIAPRNGDATRHAATGLAERQAVAAELIAAGEMSLTAIAAQLGIGRTTLWAWRHDPAFARLVAQRVEEHRAEILLHGIALKEQRIKALADRWDRMRRLIEARAADMQGVPGGDTGLLVRRVRGIGQGDNFRQVETYETDVGLLRELHRVEESAARQLGQWQEPAAEPGPREVDVTGLSTAELIERARLLVEMQGLIVIDPASGSPDVEGDGVAAPGPFPVQGS
jgi:hypothetical protein